MASSITDYTTLQTVAASWLNRTGDTAITGKMPDFIANAENLLSSRIKARAMETRTNLTATGGNAYVALPTDMVEARRLIVSSTDPLRVLKYVSPDEMTLKYPYSTTGEPEVWTVIGGNIQLGYTPDTGYTLELTYLQKIPSLSGSTTTNWLITSWPNVYLHAVLGEACMYMGDDANAQKWLSRLDKDVDAINAMDWYSGSTMQVRVA